MSKLFEKQQKRCEICQRGIQDRENNVVFCEKHGVMDMRDCCHSFKYNPLERIPEKPKVLPVFSAEDFKID